MNFPWGALARLGLARAYAMQGDTAKAKAGLGIFLTIWKDADPDVPILKAAMPMACSRRSPFGTKTSARRSRSIRASTDSSLQVDEGFASRLLPQPPNATRSLSSPSEAEAESAKLQ